MPGRGRVRGVVASRADDLSLRRDALDAEQAERRRREDAALRLWAGLTVQLDEIEAARDGELERLEAERVRVRDVATQRVASVEADQAAVLLELNRDGRAVDQLSKLFGLPLKQVREMLRVAKATGGAAQAQGEVARTPGVTRADTAAAVPDTDAAPERDPDEPTGAKPTAGELPAGEFLGTEPADGAAGRPGAYDESLGATRAVVGSG